jgi:hypothetical protein
MKNSWKNPAVFLFQLNGKSFSATPVEFSAWKNLS